MYVLVSCAWQCSGVPALEDDIARIESDVTDALTALSDVTDPLTGPIAQILQDSLEFLSAVLESFSKFFNGLSLIVMELAMNVNALLVNPVGTSMEILSSISALINTLSDEILAESMMFLENLMTEV